MYDSSGGALHECDNCGAKLPAPDEQGTRTCSFCHTVYTAKVPTAPQPVNYVINVPTPTATTDFAPINPPPKTSGCGCGLLVIVLILAAIGGATYWGVQSGSLNVLDAFKPSYNYQQQIVPIPGGEPSANPGFVTVGSHYDGSAVVYQVLRFNGTDTKPIWVSQTIADVSTTSAMIVDTKHVYVIAKNKLFAFKLTDGTVAWQSAISDDVSPSECKDCLSSIGTRVIVKSKDGNLQAFNQDSGAPAWSRRLENTSSRLIRVGANLILLDGKAGKDVLSTLDLATGLDAAIVDAFCRPAESSSQNRPSTSDEFLATPAGDGLLVLYEGSPACVQSFDPATGALQWGVVADRTSFDGSSMNVIDSPDGLIIGDDSAIGIIAPDRAAYRDLGSDTDLDYLPIGVSGPFVIAEVQNNRGTPKTSIVGIEIATGQLKWETSFGTAKSVDAPNSSWSTWSSNMSKEGTFTARVDGNKVYILTVVEDGTYLNHISIDTVDTATGTPGNHVQFDAETKDLIPSFGPPTWFGTRVLTRIGDDTIQLIDTATGKRIAKV